MNTISLSLNEIHTLAERAFMNNGCDADNT